MIGRGLRDHDYCTPPFCQLVVAVFGPTLSLPLINPCDSRVIPVVGCLVAARAVGAGPGRSSSPPVLAAPPQEEHPQGDRPTDRTTLTAWDGSVVIVVHAVLNIRALTSHPCAWDGGKVVLPARCTCASRTQPAVHFPEQYYKGRGRKLRLSAFCVHSKRKPYNRCVELPRVRSSPRMCVAILVRLGGIIWFSRSVYNIPTHRRSILKSTYLYSVFYRVCLCPHEQEACWTLSNIVAGTPPQMAAVCDSPGLLGGVIELLSGDVWEVQKEANFVVSNVATASDGERANARAAGSRICLFFGVAFFSVVLRVCQTILNGAVQQYVLVFLLMRQARCRQGGGEMGIAVEAEPHDTAVACFILCRGQRKHTDKVRELRCCSHIYLVDALLSATGNNQTCPRFILYWD